MTNLFVTALEASTTGNATTSTIMQFGIIALMLVVMYFILIRPQRKKEKEQRSMRDSLEVGDGITTIGGIVGRVVSIKEDTVLIETGSDRTKIRFQKAAIQDVEKLKLDE